MEIYGKETDDRIVARNVSPSTELVEIWGMGGHDHITAPGVNPAWVSGGPGNDTVVGGSGRMTAYGYYGDDALDARKSDYANLYGDIGNDILLGGNHGNVLDGGEGKDTMQGGLASDVYYVDAAGDLVIEQAGSSAVDWVYANISYTLGHHLETLVLTGPNNTNGRGNAAANQLTGNWYNNRLEGLAGNDTISGEVGNDLLRGGAGRDVLKGGSGRDVFDFDKVADSTTAVSGRDTVTDFKRAEGDRIDLSTIDAKAFSAGTNEAFRFIGSAAFGSNASGQLRYVYDAATRKGMIYGSIDADADAEFAIAVNGVPQLLAADFVL